MRKAAAVVIGVNTTGGLTPLTSAADGAERLAHWLASDGFDVTCLTDRTTPVTRHDIEQAIRAYVTMPARYELLLVYFSGHGYWSARNDTWLLSGAPDEPEEAVNLFTATERAKYTGIPNIVFISDACRSIPDSRTASSITGTGLFPSFRDVTRASKIDSFKATLEAIPAWEGMIDGRKQSLLTAALLSAFEQPEPDMIRDVQVGGGSLLIIPNRRLEDYLQRKVDEFLAVIDPMITQDLDITVPSSDLVYLATVRQKPQSADVGAPPDAPLPMNPPAGLEPLLVPPPHSKPSRGVRQRSAGREVAAAISSVLSTSGFGGAMAKDALTLDDPVAAEDVRARTPVENLTHLESQCGFGVSGAVIADATVSQYAGAAHAEVLSTGTPGGEPGLIRIFTSAPVSCAIRFADGRSTVVAALPGYIGHIAAGPDGVRNVSYVPSNNTSRYADYEQRRDELDQMRALVAVAVERNVFAFRSARTADALASRIRFVKTIDPTLGLYAGLAFSRSGNETEQTSVMLAMRDDLGADLYDVRVFADRLPVGRAENVPVVPFCPMLTESWNLLIARDTKLDPMLHEMRGYLANSLWSTFNPDIADDIFNAINSGAYR